MKDVVTAYAESIDNKLQSVDADKLEELTETLNIDFEEHFAFQNLQAEAFAMQKISQNDAMLIHNALGAIWSESNGGWHTDTTLAMKFTVTKFAEELLSMKVKTRRR